MVSKASEDLPEPESPVITTRRSRGISRSMFLRLCSRAPLIVSLSAMFLLCRAFSRAIARPYRPERVLYRRDHARRIRRAQSRDFERGPMIGRGADERQANRDVDRAIKLQGLERDQALIVIHRNRGV